MNGARCTRARQGKGSVFVDQMIERFAFLFLIFLLAGCVASTPQVVEHTGAAINRTPPRPAYTGEPLIIEVALLPEPGPVPCLGAPVRRSQYISEVRECCAIGASVVRVQPIAADSTPKNYHYDRSLSNYRSIVAEVLRAAPEAVIDLDIEGAGEDVREWARNNARVELSSTGGREELLEPAGGAYPMAVMRRVISNGRNLRIGLHESHAWPYQGRATNLDYVRQAIAMAHEAGRPIATPSEAREFLQLQPLKNLYVVLSSDKVRPGETIFIEAIVSPIEQPFKAYAVIVTPRGRKYSITKKGKLMRGILPFAGGKEMKNPACKTLIEMAIPQNAAPGAYAVNVAIFSSRAPVRPWAALEMAETTLSIE